MLRKFTSFFSVALCLATVIVSAQAETVFPGAQWARKSPAEAGMESSRLDAIATQLGGRGCIIKDGYVVKEWGDQAESKDWLSSVKPVISTLLFFAIEEGKVKSVDQPIAEFGWELQPRHQGITFRHLGAMNSGYARPEGAGEAWAYNDFAIQLYQKTLFDKVFQAHGNDVASTPERLGPLGFEDGLRFSDKHRMKASVRDFARIVWFWCQKGNWNGTQLLPRKYFDECMKPQTAKDLPQTLEDGKDDDYLGLGSFGGGSDHFTQQGPGIYGFNWWFNDTGRLNPDIITWPDAPADTVMSLGAGGNCSAFIPSLNVAVIAAQADWGAIKASDPEAKQNQVLKLLTEATTSTSEIVATSEEIPAIVSGTLQKWQPVFVDFAGPQANASDSEPNPFLDYRLTVTFTAPSGKKLEVPGFFAGDGAGGLSGNVWRAILSPDETGEWKFKASFREGKNCSVSLDKVTGKSTGFNGESGNFEIAAAPEIASDFYRWGRLEYAQAHYLKFRDGGYWLKGGTDEPEDLLGYLGFANTEPGKFGGHSFANHAQDWREGDPDWDGGKGKNIIGALNYLADQKVNSIYFMPMNIGGDGKNAHPYLTPINLNGKPDNDNLHFDLTKLHQWGIVLDHAQRRGLMLHFVLNEAEERNKIELDGGHLGLERKLYYRELVARFGHHPGLLWNLCEEYNLNYNLGPSLVKEYARYLKAIDPYDNPITVHHSSTLDKTWTEFLGDEHFPVGSFQINDVSLVEVWRDKSVAAGLPLVIGMDEYFPDTTSPENTPRHRREYLWPIYFSGGNVEFILSDLLKTDDFRKWEELWKSMAIARTFMESLPFWEMQPSDALLSGSSVFEGTNNKLPGQVFVKSGEIYAVYLPLAEQSGTLDLSGAEGAFAMQWFNPRTGEYVGEAREISGGVPVELGAVPDEPGEDWVALIKRP
jgi:CubicO group peptidase (beta-lactamase class C family)